MATTRRALLGATGLATTAALAGCTSLFGGGCVHTASFDMSTADTGTVVDAYATRFDELGPLDRDLGRAAIAGDAATVTVAETEPGLRLTAGVVARDGAFYRFSTSLADSTERTGYRVRFEAGEDVETAASSAEAVAFEDLPDSDRRALLVALLNDVAPKLRERKDGGSIGFESTRTLVYPSDEAASNSVLVPESDYGYVTYDGLTIAVSMVETLPTVTARTYEVAATRVADSTAEFVDAMQQAHGVDLATATLSAAKRDILDTAISEEYGYDECLDETPPPAFADLMATIFGFDEELQHAYAGTPRLVRYDGTTYLATYSVAVA